MTKYGKKRSFKVENLLFHCQLKNIPIFEPYDETKNTFELFHQIKNRKFSSHLIKKLISRLRKYLRAI